MKKYLNTLLATQYSLKINYKKQQKNITNLKKIIDKSMEIFNKNCIILKKRIIMKVMKNIKRY